MSLLAILLLLATPGEASAPAAGPPTKAFAEALKDRMVCRAEQRPNSRFQTKVCRRLGDMKRSERAAEDYAREASSKPSRAPDERP